MIAVEIPDDRSGNRPQSDRPGPDGNDRAPGVGQRRHRQNQEEEFEGLAFILEAQRHIDGRERVGKGRNDRHQQQIAKQQRKFGIGRTDAADPA